LLRITPDVIGIILGCIFSVLFGTKSKGREKSKERKENLQPRESSIIWFHPIVRRKIRTIQT